jgi:site-specific recombinase XerC
VRVSKQKERVWKGRALRECLQSKERKDYIAYLRREGISHVSERQQNRYVDEFLRFLDKTQGHTNPQKITKADIHRFAKHLQRDSKNIMTAQRKLRIAIQWLRWLVSMKRLDVNPTEGLMSSRLLPK